MIDSDQTGTDRQPSRTWAGRIGDWLEGGLIAVAGAAFVAVSALIIVQVFFRYVLQAPPIWTEELTRYIFVWLAWLSAAVVFRKGQHVTIEAITTFVPTVLRPAHNVLVRVVCVGVLVLLARNGIEALQFATNRSAALNIPMIYVYASAPVAAIIMLALVMLDAAEAMLRRWHGYAD